MNREIKFRAWDNYKNKMLYVVNGVIVDDEEYFEEYPNHIKWDLASEWPEIYFLMQFTGLKDKNGIEIYEGDIVSWTRRVWINALDDETDISHIEWIGSGLEIKASSFGWEGEDLWN